MEIHQQKFYQSDSHFQMECVTAILDAKTLSIEAEVNKNGVPF